MSGNWITPTEQKLRDRLIEYAYHEEKRTDNSPHEYLLMKIYDDKIPLAIIVSTTDIGAAISAFDLFTEEEDSTPQGSFWRDIEEMMGGDIITSTPEDPIEVIAEDMVEYMFRNNLFERLYEIDYLPRRSMLFTEIKPARR